MKACAKRDSCMELPPWPHRLLTQFTCLKHGRVPELPFQSKHCRNPSPSENRQCNLANNVKGLSRIVKATPAVLRPSLPLSTTSRNCFSMADQPPTIDLMIVVLTTAQVSQHKSCCKFPCPSSRKDRFTTILLRLLSTLS